MTAATIFETILVGCVFQKAGPSITLRFQHPPALGGVAMGGYRFGDDSVSDSAVRFLVKTIVQASGRGLPSKIDRVPCVAYLNEDRDLVGLMFEGGNQVDFRTILS